MSAPAVPQIPLVELTYRLLASYAKYFKTTNGSDTVKSIMKERDSENLRKDLEHVEFLDES